MRCLNKLRGRRGATIIIVLIVLVALLGMAAVAIDIGQLHIARQRAQNVCDSAALAGGMLLDGTSDSAVLTAATAAAEQSAVGNNSAGGTWQAYKVSPETGSPIFDASGNPEPGVTVTFPPESRDDPVATDAGIPSPNVGTGEAIRTRACVKVDYGFARIFGYTSKYVNAKATVILDTAPRFCTDFVPLAISYKMVFGDETAQPPIPQMVPGTLVTLHYRQWDNMDIPMGPGNYASLRLVPEDEGTSDYRMRLRGGYDPPICLALDDTGTVTTEPGSMGPNTIRALMDRLAKEPPNSPYRSPQYDDTAFDTWLAAPPDPVTGLQPFTWRIIVLPVVEDVYAGGHHTLTIRGMAGFFIRKLYDNQAVKADPTHVEGDVDGYFLQGIKRGNIVDWTVPDGGPTPLPPVVLAPKLIS